MAVSLQFIVQEVAQFGIVVDQQQFRHGLSPKEPPAAGSRRLDGLRRAARE
jgi:hypothetical protein